MVVRAMIKEYTLILQEILDRGIHGENAFVSLVITGEELLRAVQLKAGNADTDRALASYKNVLPNVVEYAPDDLFGYLDENLQAMLEYAVEPAGTRNVYIGHDVISSINDVLYVAAAQVRVGVLSKDTATALGAAALLVVAKCAPQLHDLWDYTEMCYSAFGPSEVVPGLHAWEEELAELSSFRLDLQLALSSKS
jgi:hypothetical protein